MCSIITILYTVCGDMLVVLERNRNRRSKKGEYKIYTAIFLSNVLSKCSEYPMCSINTILYTVCGDMLVVLERNRNRISKKGEYKIYSSTK